MRDNSYSEFIGDKSGYNSRPVAASITVSDKRMVFTKGALTGPGTVIAYDAWHQGMGGVVEVAIISGAPNTIWYRITGGSGDVVTVYTAWTQLTAVISSPKFITFNSGELYYADNRSIYKRTYTTSWSAESWMGDGADICGLSLATDYLYLLTYVTSEASHYGLVDLYSTDQGFIAWVERWKGRIPNVSPTNSKIYAENGTVYIDGANNQPQFFDFKANVHGTISPIIPLDTLDDSQAFSISGVSFLDTQAVITGQMYRKNNAYTLMYLIGQREFTTGLDYFIDASDGTSKFAKMFVWLDKLYVIGPNFYYWSPCPALLGGAFYGTPVDIGAGMIQANFNQNVPSTLTAQFNPGLYDGFGCLEPGMEVTLNLIADGTTVEVPFVIDATTRTYNGTGDTAQLNASSKAMRALSMWESDNFYDYWSQTKSNGFVKDLTKMVRHSGTYADNGDYLYQTDFNSDGFLYLTERASTSGQMRARFKRTSGNFATKFGLVLNFKRETLADATVRLGRQASDSDCEKSAWVIIQGETEHSDGPGIGVYYYSSLASPNFMPYYYFALTIARDTWYWLMADYFNGHITIYGATDNLQWSTVGEFNGMFPFSLVDVPDADLGRCGIYMKSITGGDTCYAFQSDSTVIPVTNNAQFPASDTVIVGAELIAYASKSANVTVSGFNFMNGERFAVYYPSAGTNNQKLGYDNRATAIRFAPPRTSTPYIRSFTFRVQKIGNPSDGLEVSIVDPATTYGTYGLRKAMVMIPANAISADGYVTVTFSSPVQMATNLYFQIMKSRFSEGNSYSTTNYYNFVVGTDYGDANATIYYDVVTDSWHGCGGAFGYEIWTYMASNPNSPTVHVTGTPGYNGDFVGQALVAISGPGVGACAKVKEFQRGSINSVFFVDTDISSLMTSSTVLAVVPALGGLTRTTPVAHSAGKVDIYRAGALTRAGEFAFVSGEEDLSLEDVIRKISRHAGVTEFYPRYSWSGMILPSTNTTTFDRRSPIFAFRGSDTLTGNIDCYFRMALEDPTGSEMLVRFKSTSVEYWSNGSMVSSAPCMGAKIPYDQGIKVSAYGHFISIWQGDKLLHSFVMTDADYAKSTAYFTIRGSCAQTVSIGLSEASVRIDNFALDMGKTALSLIQQLIGNRKYFVRDNDSGLALYKSPLPVNTSDTPYKLAMVGSQTKTYPPYTRVYLEGAEMVERYDVATLRKYGNMFHRETINEIWDSFDAQNFADLFILDATRRDKPTSFTGPIWPTVEVGDSIYVQYPYGIVKLVLVDNLIYTANMASKEITFDMTVNGRIIG